MAWAHAGGPLATPEGAATTRLHAYSEDYALQVGGLYAVRTFMLHLCRTYMHGAPVHSCKCICA